MTPDRNYFDIWTSELIEHFQVNGSNFNVTAAKIKNEESKFIVRHALARLNKSDIVIVNLGISDLNHHLTGVIVDIYEAYKQGKLIYAFTGVGKKRSTQAKSPLVDTFITKEFESLEELLTHLQFDENLPS
jgi:nucleoside 2-deoxyribosyltransferase